MIPIKTDLPLTVTEGVYNDYRVSTEYESFEFSLDNDGLIYQMIHIPAIGNTHREFSPGLKEGLTLDEAKHYIYYHTLSKYKGVRIPKTVVWYKTNYEKKKRNSYHRTRKAY